MQANNPPWTKKKIDRPNNGTSQSFADIQVDCFMCNVQIKTIHRWLQHTHWSLLSNGRLNAGGDTSPRNGFRSSSTDASGGYSDDQQSGAMGQCPERR